MENLKQGERSDVKAGDDVTKSALCSDLDPQSWYRILLFLFCHSASFSPVGKMTRQCVQEIRSDTAADARCDDRPDKI